jgi:hypothetical protein
MKSEHRHELKTNELAEWIANFPQWAKENAKTIIYVSVLVAVVAGVYFWKRYEENVVSVRKQLELTRLIAQLSQSKMQILQARARGVDISYMLIRTADSLQLFAQGTKDDLMAALALIKRAEALRMELHYRFGTVSERDAKAAIERAKAGYTEAIERCSGNPSLTAVAKLGLGLCEEELGNFAGAEQIYRQVGANVSLEGTVAAAQAKLRLETMADYRGKVVFKPSPKPVTTETEILQPQLQLSPADANTALQMQERAFESGLRLPSSGNEVVSPQPSQ